MWVQNINKNKNKNQDETSSENDSVNGNLNVNDLLLLKKIIEEELHRAYVKPANNYQSNPQMSKNMNNMLLNQKLIIK